MIGRHPDTSLTSSFLLGLWQGLVDMQAELLSPQVWALRLLGRGAGRWPLQLELEKEKAPGAGCGPV